MVSFLIHSLVLAVAIWLTAQIVPGVTVTSWTALAIAALVPGFQSESWTAAILGALLTSVLSWFIGIFVKRD